MPAADDDARLTALLRRLLRAVQCLHERGYEDLWALPHFGGAGFYRLVLAPGSDVDEHFDVRGTQDALFYSSADGLAPFGWDGAESQSAENLADRLLAFAPRLLEASRRPNAAYGAWYAQMLADTEPDGLYLLYDNNRVPEPQGPIVWWPLAPDRPVRPVRWPPAPLGLDGP